MRLNKWYSTPNIFIWLLCLFSILYTHHAAVWQIVKVPKWCGTKLKGRSTYTRKRRSGCQKTGKGIVFTSKFWKFTLLETCQGKIMFSRPRKIFQNSCWIWRICYLGRIPIPQVLRLILRRIQKATNRILFWPSWAR